MTNDETAQLSFTPVTVDYTSRDYYSLREELISRVKDRTGNSWFGTDASDFGLALVESFAYMGDVVAYYIDRVANESNLITATQRSSIINLARTYGYNPAGYQAATATFLLTNKSANPITLPIGTEFSGSIISGETVSQIIFTTKSAVTIPANNGTSTVLGVHGYYVSSRNPAISPDISGELVGTSLGEPNQMFKLAENQVVDDTLSVYVQNGTSYGQWKYTLHLADYGPSDAVFTTITDENNYVSILFGDGVSGAIPPKDAAIKVDYLVGGGVDGNVAQFSINSIYKVPGVIDVATIRSSVTVTNNTAANGGVNPDTLETIKELAPLAFFSLNRAVSLDDFTSLALQIPTVGKARAKSEASTSVTLYVAPRATATSTNPYPLYDETNTSLTIQWDAGDGITGLKYDVENELADKVQIGTSLTVSPPIYVPLKVSVLYSALPQYTAAQVESQIKTLITNYYSYDAVTFGQTVYPEDIEALLKFAPGIANATVKVLNKKTGTDTRNVIVGLENELFSVIQNDITITAASSDATLASLATGSGTLSPSPFNSTFYNYSLTISPGTSSVTITPTTADVNAKIYYNGTSYSSGSGISVTTSTTITTASIQVIAQDSTTSKTYTITITKA